MATKVAGKERIARLNERRAKFRERLGKSAVSGTVQPVSKSGTYVDVSYWQAYYSSEGLAVGAVVTAKNSNLIGTLAMGFEAGDSGAIADSVPSPGVDSMISMALLAVADNPGTVPCTITGYVTQPNGETAAIYYYDTLTVGTAATRKAR
jgi:hypothetical protein